MRSVFLLLFASASWLPAQQPTLTGPVEAISFDVPTRSLRAVMGSPGAATFGPALLDNLDFASVAPHQNYGIVFESGKCLFATGLTSKSVSIVAIAGVPRTPEKIVWSATGSVAVLYSSVGAWIQEITGFPGAPVAGQPIDISSLGGSLAAVAVNAPGEQVAIALNGNPGAVYTSSIGDSFARLISLDQPTALSFSSDGQTLYALDAGAIQVTAASLAGNGLEVLALPGITNPVAIQAVVDSQSRQLLYVAGGTDRLMRILDVSTGQTVTDVPLNFQPTSLDQFGNASFVVAARSQSTNPLWLFSSTPLPAAYFIPAIQLHQPDRESGIISGRAR